MNPRLIRVVTAHFHEMQGLRTAAFALTVALFVAVPLPNQERAMQISAWLVAVAFSCWPAPALRTYYSRRAGHVVRRRFFAAPEIVWGLWIGCACLPIALQRPVPFVWAGLWALYPISVVWAAWPYRAQHALTIVAALYIIWNRSAGAPGRISNGEQMFEGLLLLGALIVAGLCDHAVLMRALPRAHQEPVPLEG
jgi:hypothetical protein